MCVQVVSGVAFRYSVGKPNYLVRGQGLAAVCSPLDHREVLDGRPLCWTYWTAAISRKEVLPGPAAPPEESPEQSCAANAGPEQFVGRGEEDWPPAKFIRTCVICDFLPRWTRFPRCVLLTGLSLTILTIYHLEAVERDTPSAGGSK